MPIPPALLARLQALHEKFRVFWERMPDLTDKDSDRAAAMKKLVEELAEIVRDIERAQ